MIKVVNDCVDCPQGCGHCGRNRNRRVRVCDCCGEEIEGDVYGLPKRNEDDRDEDLCENCLHNLCRKDVDPDD